MSMAHWICPSFVVLLALGCSRVEAGRKPNSSPQELVADAEVAVVGDVHQIQEEVQASLLDQAGWYDVQGFGNCYDYCKWSGAHAGNPIYGTRHGSFQWRCLLFGTGKWTDIKPPDFNRWDFARCSGRNAVTPRQACWKLHTARHVASPLDCSKNFSASPKRWFQWQLQAAQLKCMEAKNCFAVELQPDKCDGMFRIVDTTAWSPSSPPLAQRTALPDGSTNRVWFYSPDCQDLRYKCALFNDPGGSPVPKWKVATTDPGYTDAWRGWYDVQGCGRCHDYCRWVGHARFGTGRANWRKYDNDHPYRVREIGGAWFSCRLAGTMVDKTPPGYFETFTARGCGYDGRGGTYK